MNPSPILIATLLATALAFWLARRRALVVVEGRAAELNSLPGYYGWYAALWCGVPGLIVSILWVLGASSALDRSILADAPAHLATASEAEIALYLNDIKNLASGSITSEVAGADLRDRAQLYREHQELGTRAAVSLALLLAFVGGVVSLRRVRPDLKARSYVEKAVRRILMASSALAVLITIGIVLSLVFETLRFFESVTVSEFLFGLHWSPQTALRADQVGSSGSFGAVPVFVGTLLITALAMAVAAPIGLMSAIYTSYYARPATRRVVKPVLEVLAGVPTVVYGFFAALTLAPFVRGLGVSLGLDVASESALAAGLVMGVMIIPFISSLSDDALTAVPQSLSDGSLGLGATRSETIRQVIIPAALPGIVGAFLLAISRAIGETMIVVMAAGLAANLTVNPLEAVTTVTVQIVTLLTGDQEFDSAKTLAAFALGLLLFVVTLALNVAALVIVRKYREQYD